jgi:hypothetical protein
MKRPEHIGVQCVGFAEPTSRQIAYVYYFEATILFRCTAKDRRSRIGRPVVYRDDFQGRIVNFFQRRQCLRKLLCLIPCGK